MKHTNRPTSFRLSPEIREWLDERARQADRSLNAELGRILKKAKEDEAKKAT